MNIASTRQFEKLLNKLGARELPLNLCKNLNHVNAGLQSHFLIANMRTHNTHTFIDLFYTWKKLKTVEDLP